MGRACAVTLALLAGQLPSLAADPCACIPCDRTAPEQGNDHCGPAWSRKGTSDGCGPDMGNPNTGCYTDCAAVCECHGSAHGTCTPPAPAPAPGAHCALKPGTPPAYKPICEACATFAACHKLSDTCDWVAPKPPPAPPVPCGGHGTGHAPACSCDAGWTGGNCSTELPCGVRPGFCDLKPGQPKQYKPICVNSSAGGVAACDKLSQTCAWTAGSPAGRPCPLKFSPTDISGLWTGFGALAKAMFWAETVPHGPAGSPCDSSYPGPCTRIQCITGDYSALPQDGAHSMLSFGSGCPWTSTLCRPDDGVDKNTIVCNFGGEAGSDKEAAVSGDGTVIGPAPNYPGSGLGLHRYTGIMSGLWSSVNDTEARTTDVYLIGHDWSDDSLGVYWFPATSDSVGAWQFAHGSAKALAVGASSASRVSLQFNNHSGWGTRSGILNAAGDAITSDPSADHATTAATPGLAGWTKRSRFCTAAAAATIDESAAAAAAKEAPQQQPTCTQRLPVNSLNIYRNAQWQSATCEGPPQRLLDHRLTSGCPDYGTAGAHFGYNFSSGNLSVKIFDGSDCPCGQHTPINPWNGGGGDCTCPASRCATNQTHDLQYHVLFGMNESSAPCVPIAHETSGDCYPPGKTGGPHTCQAQKWYPTPPPTDPAACLHELAALCGRPAHASPPFQAAVASGARSGREGACLACARVAAHWNQLRVVGCVDALIASFCNGTSSDGGVGG